MLANTDEPLKSQIAQAMADYEEARAKRRESANEHAALEAEVEDAENRDLDNLAAEKQGEADAKKAELDANQAEEDQKKAELDALLAQSSAGEDKVAAYQGARDAVTARQDEVDEASRNQDGDDDDDTAALVLDTGRAVIQAAKDGKALISTVIQFIIYLKEWLVSTEGDYLPWTSLYKAYNLIQPFASPTAVQAGLAMKKMPKPGAPTTGGNTMGAALPVLSAMTRAKTEHRIGSTGDTTVYADAQMFMHGPSVVVSAAKPLLPKAGLAAKGVAGAKKPKPPPKPKGGEGNLLLMAQKKAMLLSEDMAEINGKKKVMLASQMEFELTAGFALPEDRKVHILAKSMQGTLAASAATKMTLSTGPTPGPQKPEIDLDATGQKITIDAANEYSLTAAMKAEIMCGEAAKVTIDGTIGQIGFETLQYTLAIDDTEGAVIGSATKALEITPSEVKLNDEVSTLTLEASGASLTSPKIEVSADATIEISGSIVQLG